MSSIPAVEIHRIPISLAFLFHSLVSNFRENGGRKPTLVIDLMGMVNNLCSDEVLILYGLRHKQIRLEFEKLLEKLKSIANLVFFEDGPVHSNKFDTVAKRNDEKYLKQIEVLDQVYAGVPLSVIVANIRNLPSIITFLPMVEEISKKFGRLIVTFTKECDAELVQFVNNDPSVIGIFADDSDFLIFGGRWRYFSLKHLDKQKLTTLEYDRIALRHHLQLDDMQLRVFSTIGGNDIVKYDEVRPFHEYYCGNYAKHKFPWIAAFIRDQMPAPSNVVGWIAREVLQDTSRETKDRISESLSQYKTVSLTLTSISFYFCSLVEIRHPEVHRSPGTALQRERFRLHLRNPQGNAEELFSRLQRHSP
jgi:hypothetical protein